VKLDIFKIYGHDTALKSQRGVTTVSPEDVQH